MRLIDADALKKAFCNHCDGDEPCTEPCIDIGLIETAPTVDAVQVVRCRECKWWWKVNGLCTHPKHCHDNVCAHECGKDYFCADGKRKDGERDV